MTLQPGDIAPNFALKDQNGKIRKSSDLRNKILILFFYPKDNTPGCTIEACGFKKEIKAFKDLGAEIWGVSGDNEESHRQFASKNNISYPLLSDNKNILRQKFFVPKVFGLIPGRVTFIIDKNKIIRHVFSDLLNASAHIKEALKIVKEINIER